MKKPKKKSFICYCNSVEKQVVVDAINKGCKNLNDIFDRTTAGGGPCGGSCRPDLIKLLNEMKKSKPEG